MENEDLHKYRGYLWSYFTLHADQRLRMFNYYLLASTVLFGAFANVYKVENPPLGICVLPFLLTLCSFIFWKLDLRTKYMIKNAEIGIIEIDKILLAEQYDKSNPLNIFEYDDFSIQHQGRKKGWFFSYSDCFNLFFLLNGLLGFVIGVVCLLEQLNR